MATNDIGRVTPIWRGFYSAAATYELNDIVIDTAGSVWWHKSEELTTGVIPEVGEIWDAVIDMSVFSGLIQAAITTAQTALAAAQEAVAEVTADTERAETAARNAETFAQNAAESASGVGALAQAAERSAEAAAGSATGAAGSAQAAAGSKSDAEAYAVGKRGGEDVGSTDPTYHNNAKYYAEQAASEAEAAAQSAEDAQDVLDSIPEDYSQLSADVGDLKTQIVNTENAVYDPISLSGWVKGIRNAQGSSQSYNAVSSDTSTYTIDMLVSVFGDCKASLYYYDENNTYIGKVSANGSINTTSGDWKYFTGDIDVSHYAPNNAKYFALSILPTDDTIIEDAQDYADHHCVIQRERITPLYENDADLQKQIDLIGDALQYKTASFDVDANQSHSSGQDQIVFSVPQGEGYFVMLSGTVSGQLSVYEYNGEGDPVYKGNLTPGVLREFTASGNMEKVGIYIEAQSAAYTATLTVYASDSVLSSIDAIKKLSERKANNASAYVSGNDITWTTGATCRLTVGNDIQIRAYYGTASNNIIKTVTKQALLDAVQSSGLSTVSVSDDVIVGASFAIVYSFADNSIKVLSPTNKEIYNDALLLFVHHYASWTGGALVDSAEGIKLVSALTDIDDLKSDVEDLHEEIVTDGYAIPDFLSPLVDNMIETLETSCTEKTMLIAFTTDNHYGATDGANWPDTIGTIRAINSRYKLDAVIDGGDMINGNETAANARNRLAGMIAKMNIANPPAYAAVGNHDDDSFTSSTEVLLPQTQLYALMGRPFSRNYDAINRAKPYGYKDFPMFGIRLIVMDSRIGDVRGDSVQNWGYDSEQIAWLENTALDTDYQVMIFCHMPLTKEYAVSNLQPVNGADVREILESFIAGGGTVIGWFHGHTHWDFIGQHTEVNGFHEVSTGCSRVQALAPSYTPTGAVIPARAGGTATQELYDIIAVKPDSRTVQMFRFGAGSNRSFTY